MMRLRHNRTRLMTILGSLFAVGCGAEAILPGGNEPSLEVVGEESWAGGELRVMVRHAEGEQAPVTLTLDGTLLAVTRVDDSTFTAILPQADGPLPLRLEADGIAPLETTIILHGYRSTVYGPEVAGPVVRRPGNGPPVVLGGTWDAAVEVSLANGDIARTWPLSVHSLKCGVGIVPGPAAGEVLVRGGSADGSCLAAELRPFSAEGLGDATGTVAPLSPTGISAVVGPGRAVQGANNNWGAEIACDNPDAWTGCQVTVVPQANQNLRGWVAGYQSDRIVSLAIRPVIYDLASGEAVRRFTDDNGIVQAAAFSASGDTLLIGVTHTGAEGALLRVDALTGATLDAVAFHDGRVLGVAVDGLRDRVLVAMENGFSKRLWLRVLSTSDLAVEAELEVPDDAAEAAVASNYLGQLVLGDDGTTAYLVSTDWVPSTATIGSTVHPMAVVRWNLMP